MTECHGFDNPGIIQSEDCGTAEIFVIFKNMEDIVIIGNGISGITAARHIRKHSDFRIRVISAESKHFWSRTALMYIYMGHMKYSHTKPYEDHFWEKNRIELLFGKVTRIDAGEHLLELENGDRISWSKLIIATGSGHNNFRWKNSDLSGISGMISLQNLEYIEKYTADIEHGVIVGGGLIGVELAEMLRSRNIQVTFLVREPNFWGNVLPAQEAAMIAGHIREHGVDLRLSTELDHFLGDDSGRIRAAVTKSGEEIPCQFAGLTAGVHPNIELVRGTDIETDRGILVDNYLATSVPDIYAIGDCAQLRNPRPGRRSIEPVWYTGRMMGETVAQNIIGNPTTYRPGPWFNSAKFFDIEYQTYGLVAPECPENEEELYWQHAHENIALHIRFERETKKLCGINSFGMRLRHSLIDSWLRNGISVVKFLESLQNADFNPEFSGDHARDICERFNSKFPEIPVKQPKRRKILGLI